MARGEWPRATLSQGRELAGKTLGVVGFGGIGRLTAKLARDARHARRSASIAQLPPTSRRVGAKRTALAALSTMLLAEADVVSLHVPLTAATRNLIDAARLARDEARRDSDQHGARRRRRRSRARARVARPAGWAAPRSTCSRTSRLPRGSPLAGVPNLLLTPHIAGVTRESNVRVSTMIAEQVAAFLLR